MSTLSYEQLIEASAIFDELYANFKKRYDFLQIKLARSSVYMLTSAHRYFSQLHAANLAISSMGNEFSVLDREYYEARLSNDEVFLGECQQLLAGQHVLNQFAQSMPKATLQDVYFVEHLAKQYQAKADKVFDTLVQQDVNVCWKSQAWRAKMACADLASVLVKCEALRMALSTPSDYHDDLDVIQSLLQVIDNCDNGLKSVCAMLKFDI